VGRRAAALPHSDRPASAIFPDLARYQGPPLAFGRMEATASDPSVYQQFGMIVGLPKAGQVNALSPLNIGGERSVTCRSDFDRHPSKGPRLPVRRPCTCRPATTCWSSGCAT
jgi:amidase